MDYIQQLVNQAKSAASSNQTFATQPTAVPTPVQVPSVDQTYNIAAGQMADVGALSSDPLEHDLRTLSTWELQEKYGPEQGRQLAISRSLGQAQLQRDIGVPRNFSQTATDVVTDIGLGAANMIGGTGAALAGVVSSDAGTSAAKAMESLNNFVQDRQSPGLKAARRVVGAQNAQAFRDNEKQMKNEIASGSSEAISGIRRVLRDYGSSIVNNAGNTATLGSLVSQGIGSVLPVGMVSSVSAVGGISRAALATAVQRGSLSAAEAAAIMKKGSAVGAAGAIGVMEAGGAYQQSVTQVLGMDHKQLYAGSPEYKELVDSGVTPEEAQKIIANKAGLASAGMTLPFAIVLGNTVARFEANPVAAVTATGAVRNVATQTFEESAQGGVAQALGNVAIQATADSNQDITDGVGDSMATGALAGAGMAGIMQIPGVATNYVAPLAQSARQRLSNLGQFLQSRGQDAATRTPITPTASMPVIVVQAANVQAQAPAMAERMAQAVQASDAAPEVKEQQLAQIDRLTKAFSYTPDAVVPQAPIDDELGTKLQSSTSLIDAIRTTGEHMVSSTDPMQKISSLIYLDQLMAQVDQIAAVGEGAGAINAAADPEAKAFVAELVQVLENYTNAPDIAKFREAAYSALNAQAAPTEVTPETAPEITARANYAPQTLTHRTVQDLLAAHRAGTVQLTPNQVMRLEAAEALTAAMDSLDDAEPMKIVNREITDGSGGEGRYPSALAHFNNIMQALSKGNVASAQEMLGELGNFAKTLNNKVAAWNRGIDSPGSKQTYQNWANGKWRESEKALVYHLGNERSARLGETIANEAKLVTAIHNNLLDKFEQLRENAQPVSLVQLSDKAVSSKKKSEAKKPASKKEEKQKPGEKTISSLAEAELNKRVAFLEKSNTPENLEKNTVYQALKKEQAKRQEAAANKAPEDVAPNEDVKAPESKEPEAKTSQEEEEPKNIIEQHIDPAVTEALVESMDTAKDFKKETKFLQAKEDKASENADAPANNASTDNTTTVFKDVLDRVKSLLPTRNGGENMIARLFKKSNKQSRFSALAGNENAYDVIFEALSSPEAFQAFTGSKTKLNADQLENAQTYFNEYGYNIIAAIQARMEDYLNSQAVGNKDLTQAEYILRLAEGQAVPKDLGSPEEWKDGRGAMAAFLALSRDAQGNPQGGLDEYFVTAAGLAAAQYMLTAVGKGVAKYSEEQVASILGVPTDFVTDSVRSAISTGIDYKDAIRDIAQSIERMLGIEGKPDAPIGKVQSYSLALAIAAFDAMNPEEGDQFYFTKRIFTTNAAGSIVGIKEIDEKGKEKVIKGFTKRKDEKYREITRYIPVKPALEKPDVGISSVLTELLDVEPDNIIFFNKEDLKASETQLRSRTPLTARERKAQEVQQETPHRLNPPFAKLLSKLGMQDIQKLLGGFIGSEKTNAKHKVSLDGKGTTIGGSWNQVQFVLSEINSQAQNQGKKPEEVEVFYKYETTSTGRSMMQGKYNPQSDKVMRNLVMPMSATLDLTNEGDFHIWEMASIQMLGERTYEMLPAQVTEKANAIFGHPDVQAAVAVFERVLKDEDVSASEIVEAMQKAAPQLKDGATPEAMHVLLDRARFNMEQDKTKFVTRLYLEADGVANGPAGAMVMLTSNPHSKYVENMAKAGLFIGNPEQVMAMHRQKDGVDLYAAAGASTGVFAKNKLDSYGNTKNATKMKAHHEEVLGLLSNLLETDDIIFDPSTQELKIKRGVTKNPLTITVYGSGSKGIAGKILGIVEDLLAERLTEAMRTGDSTKIKSIQTALKKMVQVGPVYVPPSYSTTYGYWTLEETKNTDSSFLVPNSYEKFELTNQQRAILSNNIHHFFVKSLVLGIESTVGSDVMQNTKAMIAATNVQSTLMQQAYLQELENLYEQKRKENPEWDPIQDGISKNDLKALEKKLTHLNIRLTTENQIWDIAESQELVDNNATAGTSMLNHNKYRMPLLMTQPGSPGVSVVPYLVIGMGDSAMVQNLYTSEQRPLKSIQVFDGINLSLDEISKGEVVNKAMADAWLNNNPMRVVADSLRKAMTLTDIGSLVGKLNQEQAEKLKRTLKPFGGTLQDLLDFLYTQADGIDRVHDTVNKLGFAADQMAATNAPYVVEGTTNSKDLTEIVEVFFTEMGQAITPQAPIDTVLSGAEAVTTLVRSSFIKSKDLRNLALRALRSNGQGYLKDMKLYRDEPAKLIAAGVVPADMQEGFLDGQIQGFWNPVTKTLVMSDKAGEETLVHELIHAATLEVLHAHANDAIPTNGFGRAITDSITSLETILDDLLTNGWDVSRYSEEAKKSYADMMGTIYSYLGSIEEGESYGDKPITARMNALNEMMAWVLANRAVREMSALQKFKRALKVSLDFIKKVLFGDNSSPPGGGLDVLSKVEFFTAGLMEAQGKLTAPRSAKTTLMHTTAYGQDARIQEIGRAFSRQIGKHIESRASLRDQILAETDAKAATLHALELRNAVQAAGLLASPQEAAAFTQISQALATQAKINPLVLNEAQALFKEVVDKLKVTDFLPAGETDPVKIQAAQIKLDMLTGDAAAFSDPQGRSALLPAFIALGMVDSQVRQALSKVATPSRKNKIEGTWDEKLQTAANNAMQSLNGYLLNQGKNTQNIEDALDSLAQTIIDDSIRLENIAERLTMTAHNGIDSINDYVVNAMDSASKKVGQAANNVAAKSTNKAVKTTAKVISLGSNIFNEEGAKINAEAMITAINKTKLPEAIKSIVKDLTSRTDSNALIYDMVKMASNKVSKIRQFFKEHLPSTLNKAFDKPPTEEQWTQMYKVLAKTDIAVLGSDVEKYVTDSKALEAEIQRMEKLMETQDPQEVFKVIEKAKQLANYMVTGLAGPMLNRNADAVAHLVTDKSSDFRFHGKEKSKSYVNLVDQYISLQALALTKEADRKELAALFKQEPAAMKQLVGVLRAQTVAENENRTVMARFNAMKGYIPSIGSDGARLEVRSDTEMADMRAKGFIRVGDYTGSSIFKGTNMGYYYSPVNGKAPYNQGIFQNARMTSGGVDIGTGYAVGFPTAGRITQKATVERLARNAHLDNAVESLMPIVDMDGKIIAFERSIDPAQLERLNPSTHLAKMLGQWAGRRAEEDLAWGVNQDAMARAYAMWNQEKNSRADEYINVLDPKAVTDPVMRDALKLMPAQVRDEANRLFGKDTFMVRKDVFEDLFGYRDASFSDFWNGNSRWSKETQDRVKGILTMALGKDALAKVLDYENKAKNLIKDAKTLIVVKSVVVPVVNFTANIFQLLGSGVPITAVYRGMRDKLVEVDSYTKTTLEMMDLKVELLAAEGDTFKMKQIQTKIKAIEDGHKRLSIWPLIEAGEFGSITDVGISRDEILLTEGKLQAYLEAKTDKLPEGLKTLGKNIVITKDTALFQGLQKSMEYGDFLAKAVLFDHLTGTKKQTVAQALGTVTDEFVNYDRLPGRFRGTLENFGLAWFYNYKIRIAKIAFRMIRQDPVRVALLAMLPVGIELPVTENVFTKAVEGSLGHSLGPGMAFDSIGLNPFVNALF